MERKRNKNKLFCITTMDQDGIYKLNTQIYNSSYFMAISHGNMPL